MENERPPPNTPAEPLLIDESESTPGARSSVPRENVTDATPPLDRSPARIRGRALDERTLEPLPELGLWIEGVDEDEDQVVTDADGRFASTVAFTRGVVQLFSLEPDLPDSFELEASFVTSDPAEEHELRFAMGPTYLLDLGLPADTNLQGFHTRVSSKCSSWVVGWSSPGIQVIRAGTTPWVRFCSDQVPSDAGSTGPWFLEVTSADGLAGGSATVESIVGRYPTIVNIELEARAALRGVVRRAPDLPVDGYAYLTQPGADGACPCSFGEDGEYEYLGLEPGHYQLRVAANDHGETSAELDLRAGVETVQDFLLPAVESAGSIVGVVRSQTGTCRIQGEVCLWGYQGSVSNRRERFRWTQEDGVWVSRFVFEDVPAGRYRLLAYAFQSPLEMIPNETIVAPPAGPIAFELHDDVPLCDIVFRARNADTGDPIDGFTVWYRPPHGWASMEQAQNGEALVSRYPADRHFAWAVGHAGYQLAEGEDSDLRTEGERRAAEVSLPPGWGGQFFVSEAGPEESEPSGVEGLWLLCDGVRVGPTRSEGRLPVSLPQRPTHVTLATRGWHIVGGEVDRDTGALDVDEWWAIPVVVARD